MAAPNSSAQSTASPSILPLPPLVAEHHARTLQGPMREWASTRKLPPVLLLTGVSGIGKRSVAYHLAQWILCERVGLSIGAQAASEDAGPSLFGETPALFADEPTPKTQNGNGQNPPLEPCPLMPCNECTQCLRALKGSWVDFTEITPEDDDAPGTASGALKIDQFRKLKSSLGFGAHEGKYRIILIPNADRMTPQAANSMLKLLEEPPSGWIFFLTASDPTLILPTVLSRCQSLRLKPFAAAELLRLLEDASVPAARARLCAGLAQGSWGKAFELATDELWETRGYFFDFFVQPGAGVGKLLDWASQDVHQLSLMLDQLELFLAELLRWSVTPPAEQERFAWANAANAEQGRALATHARNVSARRSGVAGAREFWLGRVERLARMRQEMLTPLNRKLLVQDLLLPFLEIAPSP